MYLSLRSQKQLTLTYAAQHTSGKFYTPETIILEPKNTGAHHFREIFKKTHHLQVPYDNVGWNNFSSPNPHSAHAPAIPLHDFPVPVVQFGDEIEKGGATIKAQSEIGHHDIHVDLHVATWHAAKTGERM